MLAANLDVVLLLELVQLAALFAQILGDHRDGLGNEVLVLHQLRQHLLHGPFAQDAADLAEALAFRIRRLQGFYDSSARKIQVFIKVCFSCKAAADGPYSVCPSMAAG